MIVAITGGIGTGKSTVCEILGELGAYLIDADRIARDVMRPGHAAFAAVVKAFGADLLDDSGEIRRKLLRQRIFVEPELKLVLEGIIHPIVKERMEQEIEEALRSDPSAVIVCEVPLLFESGIQDRFDIIVVVTAGPEIQHDRLCRRDGIGPERELEIDSQLPIEEKARRADHVVDNSGSIQQTRRQTEQLWHRLGNA